MGEYSNLSAGSCSALINPGSLCHFSHPILQSYTVIIGLNSVVKSLLPMSVDKSRKLFVAKILRLHFFYQKWALTPLQGWTIGGACPPWHVWRKRYLTTTSLNFLSEWFWNWPNVLNIPFRIAFWNLSPALKNLETYSSRRLLSVNLLAGVLPERTRRSVFFQPFFRPVL